MNRRQLRIFSGLASAGIALVLTQSVLAQGAAPAATKQDERKALSVVRDWTAAFANKDADKAASYMEDNVQFRVDPSDPGFSKGRDTARNLIRQLVGADAPTPPPAGAAAGPPRPKMEFGAIKLQQIYAIGDSNEVVVIVRRIDELKLNGKSMSIPIGAFYRVNPKDGKIEEWLDDPLIKIGAGPPPSAPPGGGAR
jgi:ketosteroid isomerase-like protein